MEKIAHIDGIAMEDYMYSQYKDIQFELAYLSRIVKYLKPRIKNLKDKKNFMITSLKTQFNQNLHFVMMLILNMIIMRTLETLVKI